MYRKAKVFNYGEFAGIIEECAGGYRFTYDEEYLTRPDAKAVSLTMPLTKKPYMSEVLFPFFFGLLTEGTMKELQCMTLKIDKDDHFGRLIRTAHSDVIGNVTVMEDISE